MIYLDNAATTLHKPQPVIDAVIAAMQSFGNSARGTHAASLTAARTVFRAREKLASFFGCGSPERVIFTSNATEALNIAICGTLSDGDHVITTDLEHNSVLRPLYRMETEHGVRLDFVPADALGNLDYDALPRLLRPETKMIVCTHASNLTGNLVDLSYIGAFARSHGLRLIVDAAQTAGVFPIDMKAMHIDLLCFTGHKGMLGPQGTGGLCLGDEIAVKPWKVGGTGVQSYSRTQPVQLPTALEAGTLNGHGIAGLSAAVDYLLAVGIDTHRQKEDRLARHFYEGVRNLPGVTVYGDFSMERAAIVALNIGEYDSGEVADALFEEYGIAVRPGAHCAPRLHRALGTERQGAVRFSFSWDNTEKEAEAAIRAVEALSR